MRRITALIMCALMFISLFPLQSFAEEGQTVPTDESELESVAEPEQDAQSDQTEIEPESQLPEVITPEECAGADSGSCGDTIAWEITAENELILTGSGDMDNYIAGTAPWYDSHAAIVSVSISKDITSIGQHAFNGFSQLTQVSIPAGVVSIEAYAFYGCRNLETLNLPESVGDIGAYAFSGCDSLADVYYGGTETGRLAITIGDNNAPLSNSDNVTWHYASPEASLIAVSSPECDHAQVSFSATQVNKGDSLTVYVTAEPGYHVTEISADYGTVQTIYSQREDNGAITFYATVAVNAEGDFTTLLVTPVLSYYTPEEELLAWISDSSQDDELHITRATEITDDLALPAGRTIVLKSALHVLTGVSVTQYGALFISEGGELYVDEGAVYDNIGVISANAPGSVIDIKGSYTGREGAVGVIAIKAPGVSVTGVSGRYIDKELHLVSPEEQTVQSEFDSAVSCGMRSCNIYVEPGSALTVSSLIVPKDCILSVGGNLTVASGAELTVNGSLTTCVYPAGSITVDAGGSLINNGSLELLPDSLQLNGSMTGTGEMNYFGPGDEVWSFAQLRQKASTGARLIIKNAITINSDYTMPEDVSLTLENAKLTVKSGRTLTLQGTDISIGDGSKLVVEPGATLSTDSAVYCRGGYLAIEGGFASIGVSDEYDERRSGRICIDMACYSSCDVLFSRVSARAAGDNLVYSTDNIYDFCQAAEDGRYSAAGYVICDIKLEPAAQISRSLTIPENFTLNLSNSALNVASGASVTNNGGISLCASSLNIDAQAELVNHGSIISEESVITGTIKGRQPQNMPNADNTAVATEADELYQALSCPGAYVTVSSDITLDNGLTIGQDCTLNIQEDCVLTVNGNLENFGQIVIAGADCGSTLRQTAGTLNNYGTIIIWPCGVVETGADTAFNNTGAILALGVSHIDIEGSFSNTGDIVNGFETCLADYSENVRKAAVAYPSVVTTAKQLRIALAYSRFYGTIPEKKDINVEKSVTLSSDTVLDYGISLTVAQGAVLTIPSGRTFTNDGIIDIEAGGRILVKSGGALDNRGSISYCDSGSISGNVNGAEPQLQPEYVLAEGVCGAAAKWILSADGVLAVSGSGSIDSSISGQPWQIYRDRITALVIKKGITGIGDYAFQNCHSLLWAELPDGLEYIGRYAFQNCGSLSKINIPDSVTCIAEYAMHRCGLCSLYIPASVTDIGQAAFAGNSALTEVKISSDNRFFKVTASGAVLNSAGTRFLVFPGGIAGACTIPDTVRTIDTQAFAGSSVTAVTVPEGVSRIPDGFISNSTKVKTVSLPASVTSVGAQAFAGCASLRWVLFAGNAPQLKAGAFEKVKAYVYYLCNDSSWTEEYRTDIKNSCGGTITWIKWHREAEATATVTAPTCTKSGKASAHCSLCDTDFSRTIPATGHDMVNDICSVCGHKDYKLVISVKDSAKPVVYAGGSLNLRAAISPAPEEIIFEWFVDETYAIINNGVLTAKAVSETHYVDVRVAEKNTGAEAYLQVMVCPVAMSVGIRDASGKTVTGKSISLDLNDTWLENPTFTAVSYPAETTQKIKWTLTDNNSARVAKLIKNADGSATVCPYGNDAVGKVTLTAAATDGSGKKATVTLNYVRYIQNGKLKITGAVGQLSSSESITLGTNISDFTSLTSTAVTWSLSSASKPFAAISSTGVLTTNSVEEPVDITVNVCATANKEASDTVVISLRPKAVLAKIENNPGTVDMTVSSKVKLAATVLPSDAVQTGKWSVNDSTIASVSKTGLVTAKKAGRVQVTFTGADGVKDSVYIRFCVPVGQISISGAKKSLTSGKTMSLTAAIMPENASLKAVTWRSSNPAAASVSSKGLVTAKTVYSKTPVTITAEAADGSSVKAVCSFNVIPTKSEKLVLMSGGEILSQDTQIINLRQTTSIRLTPSFVIDNPETAVFTNAVFTSSDTSVATVGKTSGKVTFKKTGTVTITATADNGSVKAVFKAVRYAEAIEISGEAKLAVGAVAAYTAAVTPANTTDKTVSWSVSDTSAAKVSTSGVVTALPVTAPTQLVVTAKAKDGSGIKASYTITVYPKATGLHILTDSVNVNNARKTIDLGASPTLQLKAKVYPTGEVITGKVSWSSSNKAAAKVSSSGLVTGLTDGTAVITAKAKDGSGISASLTVTVKTAVHGIKITSSSPSIRAGMTKTLKCSFTPAAPSNTGVTWSLPYAGDTAYASVSSTGVVTAKNISAVHYVTVRAVSKDNSGVYTQVRVKLYPKVEQIAVCYNGNPITSTLSSKLTEAEKGIQLDAVCLPDGASAKVTWSCSSASVATVSSTGKVTFLKAGTVTITVTAADGSGVSTKIKLKAT